MSLVVICPTRGRPAKARQAYLSFLATKQSGSTHMRFVVDADDPLLHEYEERFENNGDSHKLPVVVAFHSQNMAEALNEGVETLHSEFDYIGFIGDDHRFRTPGWDRVIVEHLQREGGGIAYGNDLMQSANLPTQVFMNASIVEALGWMALPGARHLYLDNAWKDLGEAADVLYYFPDIYIEHMHPASGKSEMDEGYARVNSQETYSHDAKVYEEWKADGFERDVWKLRTALASDSYVSRVE